LPETGENRGRQILGAGHRRSCRSEPVQVLFVRRRDRRLGRRLIRSGTKPGGATGQSSAPFDAHTQFRIVHHDRASINRTSTNSANRHVAMIGTDGETIPVDGFMDR
jgi:hypothetical protein